VRDLDFFARVNLEENPRADSPFAEETGDELIEVLGPGIRPELGEGPFRVQPGPAQQAENPLAPTHVASEAGHEASSQPRLGQILDGGGRRNRPWKRKTLPSEIKKGKKSLFQVNLPSPCATKRDERRLDAQPWRDPQCDV